MAIKTLKRSDLRGTTYLSELPDEFSSWQRLSPPAEKYGFEYISLPDITTENTALPFE